MERGPRADIQGWVRRRNQDDEARSPPSSAPKKLSDPRTKPHAVTTLTWPTIRRTEKTATGTGNIWGELRAGITKSKKETRAGDKALLRGRHTADAPEWHTPQPPRVAVGGGERSLRRAGTPEGSGDQRAANDPAGKLFRTTIYSRIPEERSRLAGRHAPHFVCGSDWVRIQAGYNCEISNDRKKGRRWSNLAASRSGLRARVC